MISRCKKGDCYLKKVLRIKNMFINNKYEFGNPSDPNDDSWLYRYADLKLNCVMEYNGKSLVVEIQFLLRTMGNFKNECHKLYNITRNEEFMNDMNKILCVWPNKQQQLYYLVHNDDTSENVQLLANFLMSYYPSDEVDITKQDKNGMTIFHYVCSLGHTRMLRLLLSTLPPKLCLQQLSMHNGESNNKDTCLHFACMNGHVQVIKILVDLSFNDKFMSLMSEKEIELAKKTNDNFDAILSIYTANRKGIKPLDYACDLEEIKHKFGEPGDGKFHDPEMKVKRQGQFDLFYEMVKALFNEKQGDYTQSHESPYNRRDEHQRYFDNESKYNRVYICRMLVICLLSRSKYDPNNETDCENYELFSKLLLKHPKEVDLESLIELCVSQQRVEYLRLILVKNEAFGESFTCEDVWNIISAVSNFQMMNLMITTDIKGFEFDSLKEDRIYQKILQDVCQSENGYASENCKDCQNFQCFQVLLYQRQIRLLLQESKYDELIIDLILCDVLKAEWIEYLLQQNQKLGWKVKFGDSVQSETGANALYLACTRLLYPIVNILLQFDDFDVNSPCNITMHHHQLAVNQSPLFAAIGVFTDMEKAKKETDHYNDFHVHADILKVLLQHPKTDITAVDTIFEYDLLGLIYTKLGYDFLVESELENVFADATENNKQWFFTQREKFKAVINLMQAMRAAENNNDGDEEKEKENGDDKIVECINDILANSNKLDVSDYINCLFIDEDTYQMDKESVLDIYIRKCQTQNEKTFRLLLSIPGLDPTRCIFQQRHRMKDTIHQYNAIDRCYDYNGKNYGLIFKFWMILIELSNTNDSRYPWKFGEKAQNYINASYDLNVMACIYLVRNRMIDELKKYRSEHNLTQENVSDNSLLWIFMKNYCNDSANKTEFNTNVFDFLIGQKHVDINVDYSEIINMDVESQKHKLNRDGGALSLFHYASNYRKTKPLLFDYIIKNYPNLIDWEKEFKLHKTPILIKMLKKGDIDGVKWILSVQEKQSYEFDINQMYDENNAWTPIHCCIFNCDVENQNSKAKKVKIYQAKMNCLRLLLSTKSKTPFDIRQRDNFGCNIVQYIYHCYKKPEEEKTSQQRRRPEHHYNYDSYSSDDDDDDDEDDDYDESSDDSDYGDVRIRNKRKTKDTKDTKKKNIPNVSNEEIGNEFLAILKQHCKKSSPSSNVDVDEWIQLESHKYDVWWKLYNASKKNDSNAMANALKQFKQTMENMKNSIKIDLEKTIFDVLMIQMPRYPGQIYIKKLNLYSGRPKENHKDNVNDVLSIVYNIFGRITMGSTGWKGADSLLNCFEVVVSVINNLAKKGAADTVGIGLNESNLKKLFITNILQCCNYLKDSDDFYGRNQNRAIRQILKGTCIKDSSTTKSDSRWNGYSVDFKHSNVLKHITTQRIRGTQSCLWLLKRLIQFKNKDNQDDADGDHDFTEDKERKEKEEFKDGCNWVELMLDPNIVDCNTLMRIRGVEVYYGEPEQTWTRDIDQEEVQVHIKLCQAFKDSIDWGNHDAKVVLFMYKQNKFGLFKIVMKNNWIDLHKFSLIDMFETQKNDNNCNLLFEIIHNSDIESLKYLFELKEKYNDDKLFNDVNQRGGTFGNNILGDIICTSKKYSRLTPFEGDNFKCFQFILQKFNGIDCNFINAYGLTIVDLCIMMNKQEYITYIIEKQSTFNLKLDKEMYDKKMIKKKRYYVDQAISLRNAIENGDYKKYSGIISTNNSNDLIKYADSLMLVRASMSKDREHEFKMDTLLRSLIRQDGESHPCFDLFKTLVDVIVDSIGDKIYPIATSYPPVFYGIIDECILQSKPNYLEYLLKLNEKHKFGLIDCRNGGPKGGSHDVENSGLLTAPLMHKGSATNESVFDMVYDSPMTQTLIEKDLIDINQQNDRNTGKTMLHLMIQRYDPDDKLSKIFEKYFKNFVNKYHEKINFNIKDNNGVSILMQCVISNHFDLLKFLIDNFKHRLIGNGNSNSSSANAGASGDVHVHVCDECTNKRLVLNEVHPNANDNDYNNKSPSPPNNLVKYDKENILMIAARLGRCKCLELLFDTFGDEIKQEEFNINMLICICIDSIDVQIVSRDTIKEFEKCVEIILKQNDYGFNIDISSKVIEKSVGYFSCYTPLELSLVKHNVKFFNQLTRWSEKHVKE